MVRIETHHQVINKVRNVKRLEGMHVRGGGGNDGEKVK